VVTASAKTAVFGTSVTFWVTVSGSGPTPTGTVMLEGNGIMSAPLDSKGVAGGFVRNDLPGGSDTLVAFYSGDSYYQNGTSPPLTITITPTTPTMNVVGFRSLPTRAEPP
jgi:hypothetical protein